ncbi:unnamed protein product [Coccothraustes coccothraustes]
MGRDRHPRGMLAHRRAPGYGQTAQSRRDGTSGGAVGPHPRGWRHIPAPGLCHNTGGRRDAHILRQTPSGKKTAVSLGAAPGCHCLGTGGSMGRGTRSVRPSRLGRATLSRHREAAKGHTEGSSVASETGVEPGGDPLLPLTAAHTASPRGQDGSRRPGLPFRDAVPSGRTWLPGQ